MDKKQALEQIRSEPMKKEKLCPGCNGQGYVFEKFKGFWTCKVCQGNKVVPADYNRLKFLKEEIK